MTVRPNHGFTLVSVTDEVESATPAAIVVHFDGRVSTIDPNSVTQIQNAVGGYFEYASGQPLDEFQIPSDLQLGMLVNDDASTLDRENRNSVFPFIIGNLVLVNAADSEDGEFLPLDEAQLSYLRTILGNGALDFLTLTK